MSLNMNTYLLFIHIPLLKMSVTCCVVFICDLPYFDKFVQTYKQLISFGGWSGDVCLIVCDDLVESEQLRSFQKEYPILVKHYSLIHFPPEFIESQSNLNRMEHWNQKMFQFQKIRLFDVYFKQWNYVFYIDCGIQIFRNIQPIIDCASPNTLLAHSDTFPSYKNKLATQFDTAKPLFKILSSEFNLQNDYPQTTIMLFDTTIIEPTTVNDLHNLCLKYPISITNDQGIVALYFTCIRPLWKQLPLENDTLCFYDYLARTNKHKEYIMLKVTHIWDGITQFK
jgi:hypothetical protein